MLKLAEHTKQAYASGLVRKAAKSSVKPLSSSSSKLPLEARRTRSTFGPGTMPFSPRAKLLANQPRRGRALAPIGGVTKAVVPR